MQRLVPIALAVSLGACVADSGDEGILVLKNVAAGEGCMFAASESEPSITHGSLDLALGTGYLFIAQIKSRITALDDQVDQRTVITNGANVDLTFPAPSTLSDSEIAGLEAAGLTKYRQLFSAPLLPNGGIADAGFTLIPAAVTRALADISASKEQPFQVEALATFTVTGRMSDGDVTSQPFAYPITIGTGQTVNVVGECPLPMDTDVRPGYACNPGQDGIVDCCMEGTDLRCPATVATM